MRITVKPEVRNNAMIANDQRTDQTGQDAQRKMLANRARPSSDVDMKLIDLDGGSSRIAEQSSDE